MINTSLKKDGYILIQVIVFGAIAAYLLSALAGWATMDIKASRQAADKELAIQIAEAGIDYYRWHLAHAPVDFTDGTNQAGPYVHDFSDKDENVIGTFTLDITPPPLGSSLVIVKSTGRVKNNPNIARAISVELAKPSIAKFAVVANSVMRFGEGTEVFGPIHSNGGIRFDGLAHNVISSGASSYDDPDHTGGNEFGVHTHVPPTDPLPPANVPSRPDVFEVGRQFPVPNVDFTGITADLAQMKSDAQTNGFYRPDAGALGYHIVLKTNDTFDLYKVTSRISPPHNCTNSQNQDGWDTWSINNQTLLDNYPFPANGIIFLEDNIFIDGQINSGRLTIIAALLPDSPATRKNITINNDLLYTKYDGSDVVGLIAQGNVNVGMVSDTNLRIDAALIAQNGRIGRYYYPSDCSPYDTRQTLTLWGMIATNLRYGFAYTDGNGYQTRNLNYDGSLLYGPPPSFPLTSDQYVTLSWKEIK
jgi:hypothetical protein